MSLIERIIAFLAAKFNWTMDHTDPIPPPAAPASPVQPAPAPVAGKTKREVLYDVAKACIGKDMSPNDIAPDSLACAESLNGVHAKAFGEPIGKGAALTSTKALYELMLTDPRFREVEVPQPGDITIAPTGYSKHAPHGHCGVWGMETVMSNDSDTGLWKANYTHAAWHNVFSTTLGFPIYYFSVKD